MYNRKQSENYSQVNMTFSKPWLGVRPVNRYALRYAEHQSESVKGERYFSSNFQKPVREHDFDCFGKGGHDTYLGIVGYVMLCQRIWSVHPGFI